MKEIMTCKDCIKAKGKEIKICPIYNAPCYDKYSAIDMCKDKGCRYYESKKER